MAGRWRHGNGVRRDVSAVGRDITELSEFTSTCPGAQNRGWSLKGYQTVSERN